ncbi:hypothetical protein [Chitinophaga sp. S165]|uniref:hypothetical protein n=1 Tax=Chitinophaga sp. S165 TaxID=2135462 RepID=UPI000D713854|nr:hypothetical protein [Chitinophaga sp. S165]PWV48888.1 hypothetical protein C7475_106134 [Chitinophaga sp. S165]
MDSVTQTFIDLITEKKEDEAYRLLYKQYNDTPLVWDPVKKKITNNKQANRLLSRKMKPEWAV